MQLIALLITRDNSMQLIATTNNERQQYVTGCIYRQGKTTAGNCEKYKQITIYFRTRSDAWGQTPQ